MGSRALSTFAYSLNARVLRAHANGPLSSRQLAQSSAWAPESSLRVAVAKLRDLGALTRVEPESGSNDPATALTEAGEGLLQVVDVLDGWLRQGPEAGLSLDEPASRAVVRVLVSSWQAGIVRTLAEGPRTLSELSAGINRISYPSLKRRLAKLRSTQLVVPAGGGRNAGYSPSRWLRQAAAPLAAAARWELEHQAGAVKVSPFEVEAILLLALPLARLPKHGSDRCTFAVLMPAEGSRKPEVAAVGADFQSGALDSSTPGKGPDADIWAVGSAAAWLDALTTGCIDRLRFSGSRATLIGSTIRRLNAALFAAGVDA